MEDLDDWQHDLLILLRLGLNGDGVGLNYHFGLFRQIFENNMQTTVPDPWLTEKSWLTKMDVTYDIKFKGMTVKSRMYDIDVIGYNNTSNKLHLFDVESVDESIVEDGINFNKEDIKKNLTLFLYPDDSDEAVVFLEFTSSISWFPVQHS